MIKISFPFKKTHDVPVVEKPLNPSPSVPDHIHDWTLIAKTIVEPKNLTDLGDQELTKLALTGMTTYVFQCSKCPDFKIQEVFGLEDSALDRLIDKVEVGGPEYITREGKTYILLKKPDSQANPQLTVR